MKSTHRPIHRKRRPSRRRINRCIESLEPRRLLATSIPFTHIIIDADGPADPHVKAVGDVNGDGYTDVVAGGYTNQGLFWYESPAWQKHYIAAIGRFTTDMQAGDVDNDSDPDVIVPNGTTLLWYENPAPGGDPAVGPWTAHTIGESGDVHDLEVADIDRDGRLDVVSREEGGGNTSIWFQDSPTAWTRKTVSTQFGEGTDIGDVDGDGDLDIAQSGFWIEAPADPRQGAWTERTISSVWLRQETAVRIADVNHDGRSDVLLAPSDSIGVGRFVWFEAANPKSGPWTEHVILNPATYLHTFQLADMDDDGTLDVVTAEMHQSADPDEISIFFNDGTGRFTQQVLATTGSHNIRVADLDRDGDLDIVGANWDTATDPSGTPIEMWRNDWDGARLPLDQWEQHVADPAKPWRAIFTSSADLNGDALPDLITGGWWYQNPGAPGGAWARRTIGAPLNNLAVAFDFDGDGDIDILGTQGEGSQTNTAFAWARNDGRGNFTILTNIAPALGPFLQGAAAARFAPGRPIEVALSWNNDTSGIQMLTVPANPSQGTWTSRRASTSSQGEGIDAGDIDRDGDLDLAAGQMWLRNDGGSFTAIPLSPVPGIADRPVLADINGDGRLDMVLGYEAASELERIAWYEQPANPAGTWEEHIIDRIIGPQSVGVADMDGDGDLDVVAGEHNPANSTASRLFVYENLDGAGGAWERRLVYTGDEHHAGAHIVDLDRDGDRDITSIGWNQPAVTVYENHAVDAPTVAPTAISPGAGTYGSAVTVTLSNPTPGVAIHYTTDGSAPTIDAPLYTGPFQLNGSAVVKARGFAAGRADGPVNIALFNIVFDTKPPTIAAVDAIATSVRVRFSEPVDRASAQSMGNYAIDRGVSIGSAALSADGRTVTLSTSALADATTYTLTVSNVADITGNTIAAGSTATFMRQAVPSAGLAVWLRADAGVLGSGSAVSSWTDQAGGDNSAVQPLATAQPALIANAINGLPALRFDGGSDFLTFNLPVEGLRGMTVFLVAASTIDKSGGSSKAENAAVFWNESAAWGTVYVSPFQTHVNWRYGTGQVGNRPVYTRPAPIGSAYSLTTTVKDGPTDSLYIDGQLAMQLDGRFSTISATRSEANIGQGYNNTHFAGEIAELLVYTTALSDAERQAVEAYLGSKYFSTEPPPPPALPAVTVTATDAAAAEAGQDTATFTFSRSGSTNAGLLVRYSLGGTARAGEDYQTLSGTLTIPAGSASAIVTLTPINDAASEGNETVLLTLDADAAYALGTSSSATATIADNDAPVITVPTDGLALWLNAGTGLTLNGSGVAGWTDQAGGNNNALQTLSGSQPTLVYDALNGQPVLRFDGVNDFLSFNLPINGLSGMTIFLVASNSADRNGGASKAGNAAIFWDETAKWGTVYVSPFQTQVNLRFGTTQKNNRPVYVRPSSIGSAFSVTTAIKDGSVDSLFVDGVLVLRESGKLAVLAGNTDTASIGRGYGSTYYPGDIAEILVYTTALRDAERQQVEQYLAEKYGL